MAWVCRSCCTNNEDSDERCIICDEIRSEAECVLTREDVLAMGLTGDVLIPSEYNVIGEGAFSDNNDIKSVTLHSDVKKIMANAFSGCLYLEKVIYSRELEEIGVCAFRDCVSLDSAYRPGASVVAADAYVVSASARQKKKDLDKALEPPKAPMGEATKKKIGKIIGCVLFFILLVGFITALYLVEWEIMQWVVSVIVLGVLIFVELAMIELVREEEIYSPTVITNIVFAIAALVLLLIFKKDFSVIAAFATLTVTAFTVIVAGIAKKKCEEGSSIGLFIVSFVHLALFNTALGMSSGWDVLRWVLPVSVLGVVGVIEFVLIDWDYTIYLPSIFINGALTVALIACAAAIQDAFFPVAVITGMGLIGASIAGACLASDDLEEGFVAAHVIVAIANGVIVLVVGGHWIF